MISQTSQRQTPQIAVLAGGDSTRMGEGVDKVYLDLKGKTFLDHILSEAIKLTDSVVVSGRKELTDTSDDFPNVECLEDEIPDAGPLEGLRTVLTHHPRPTLLIGADMPNINAESIQWVIGEWRRADTSGIDGLATFDQKGLQPLFTIYEPAVVTQIADLQDEGRCSLMQLIEYGTFRRNPVPRAYRDSISNVNTMEDYRALTRTCSG
jgi:molybdopterin-guanine dinucleotide biosynthesis protein A